MHRVHRVHEDDLFAEIPARNLSADDWYTHMGTKPTIQGTWWRLIEAITVYGDEGDIRNQAHIKYHGDDAIYAALLDEMVLVRGPHEPKKENHSVSQLFHMDELISVLGETDIPVESRQGIVDSLSNLDDVPLDEVERFTKEDVRTALKTAGLDRGLDEKLEYLEAARAARRGDIRQTTAGLLNRDDHNKKIRIEHITRREELLTHVKRLENVPKVLLVLDGYIWELDPETPVWIDDASVPSVES